MTQKHVINGTSGRKYELEITQLEQDMVFWQDANELLPPDNRYVIIAHQIGVPVFGAPPPPQVNLAMRRGMRWHLANGHELAPPNQVVAWSPIPSWPNTPIVDLHAVQAAGVLHNRIAELEVALANANARAARYEDMVEYIRDYIDDPDRATID